MKNFKLKGLWMFSMALVITLFAACGNDDDGGPSILLPNLDGLYVYGTNTVATEPGNAASKVNLAILDPGQGAMVESIDGVYGKFIHIGANGTIELAYVDNKIGTIYGASGGGTVDSSIVAGGAMNDFTIHGTLIENSDPIRVTDAGLYYLYVDVNNFTFSLTSVKANMIGDATEAGWASGTSLPLKSSNATSTVFEGSGIALFGATGYRYRFNDGWHYYQSNDIVTLSSLGVFSYGEAWDSGINDLGFFLDNIPHKETGIFTITLTYNASTGEWTEVKTKTGELLQDYADTEFGWFGNAYYADGTTEGAWDAIHLIEKPTIEQDTLYHWSWNLELIQDRSFVLRENDNAGAWITYGGAAKIGSAFDDALIVKEDGQDNYFVAVGGRYNVTFTINAADEGRILTIEPDN